MIFQKMFLILPYKHPIPQQAEKMTGNARNDDSNMRNEVALEDKETMKFISRGVVRLLSSDIMVDFDQAIWGNLTTNWEDIGETIFTGLSWNHIKGNEETFEVDYKDDTMTLIHNNVIGT